MTFKKVENTFLVNDRGKVSIEASPQSVSGSDAEDSLNGNKGSLEIPLSYKKDDRLKPPKGERTERDNYNNELDFNAKRDRPLGGSPAIVYKE